MVRLRSLLCALLLTHVSGPGAATETGAALPLAPADRLELDLSEGTWMSLDVAPDGRSLLFDILGNIFSLEISGGDASPVLTGMPFEAQPVYSPDGGWIAYVSDRSGNDNVWIARPDGSAPQQLSTLDDNSEFVSPAWSADGRFVYASRLRPDIGVYELWRYDCNSGAPHQVTNADLPAGLPRAQRPNALGVVASRDGLSLYYAKKLGGFTPYGDLPSWSIVRRDIQTGKEVVVVTAQGSAMRPALSPDDRLLAYASRYEGQTGLRLRNLQTGQDRWLVYPVTTDQQEAWHTLDTMPRHAFMPDGKSLLYTAGNRIRRIDLASGEIEDIPFAARLEIDLGPPLRREIPEQTGAVQARLIQSPVISPSGDRVAFSAFGQLYVMSLDGSSIPQRVTTASVPEYQPSWSKDGSTLLYVTWTARDGGHIWRTTLDGGEPQQLTTSAGFYSYPVEAGDESIVALSSSHHERMIQAMDVSIAPARQTDVVRLPSTGGAPVRMASGLYTGPPQVVDDSERIYLRSAEGLVSFLLDGSDRRLHLQVTGAGYYFLEGRVPVDDLRISPDGSYALAQSASQLYVIALPEENQQALVLDLNNSDIAHHKLTAIGADFIGWAQGGKMIAWSVGSTIYRRPLASIDLGAEEASGESSPYVEEFPAIVELPRDVPRGVIVLRGATVIPMTDSRVITDADVVVVDNRIAAVGKRGTVAVPEGATIRDMTGRYIVPGFVDTHAHWAQIRRGILDFENYGFLANLAYGVTAGLDVSTLSIDALAYQDLLEAGLMTGLRAYSTGPAIFSFNEFQSQADAVAVLQRYKRHYRLDNLKQYRAGNRRQRQWVAQAALKLGLMPTTEGADNLKLAITQIQDGFAGHEHALPVTDLGRDMVQLMARTRAGYTPTLVLGSGPPAFARYLADNADALAEDPKVQRFFPKFVIDQKTQRGHWYRSDDYLYPRFAAGVAEISRAGGVVGVGSHSELEGLAFHVEMQALASGGMTPIEVLRAATMGSAEVIGRQAILGSLEPGKFADLVVLDADPLVDIRNTLSLAFVMKNGRLYDAGTLDELWPRQRTLPPLWFQGQGPP